ncbi:BRCA1 protein, partial [Crotophaga sulcirostris]|nr:BRCA1 protein [Crotophaga sulcirostris]
DYSFSPRFCMFKLLSKKKKGVVECPLCKTEVTKRSLKENSRFKQLIEGLMETIRAFELDTGVKFLNSHHSPKKPTEAPAAELCKESSVIQSKGFRKRKKSAKENERENCTLEANVDTQLTDTRIKRCPLGSKAQKCDSEKGVYIELGKMCCRSMLVELMYNACKVISSQEKLEELKKAEKGNSCNMQPDELSAKDPILPKVIGESDFSKEGLSKKSTWSITEHAKPGHMNVTECQSSPLNLPAVDILTEQCDRRGNASPLRDGDSSFFKNTEEMDAEQPQCNSKSKELDLKDSSESRLDKSKETDIVEQNVEAMEMYESEKDSFREKESPLDKVVQPDTPQCATLNQVSRKRLKQSIQKVNEWFSKSNETVSSNSSQDDSGEGDTGLSDEDSCNSEKTDPMVDSMEIAVVEGNKRLSKQTADNIKDRIFGKTYKRERKSHSPLIVRDILPTSKKEDRAADENCLNNSSKDRQKRKRKTARALQPEDFIKRRDTEGADVHPQSVNECLGEAEKKRCVERSTVDESHLSENREDNTVAELNEGRGSIRKKATEKVTGQHYDEFELNKCDQKSTKKRSSAAKRCRHSTRTMCALELVVDRNAVSPDPTEPQIDSYPSSEEPRKADSEQREIRRSRRLQLLTEEMKKETGKGVATKGGRKSASDHEESVFGVQRNVLVHASECEDPCEPQGTLSCKPLINLESGDLEANEIQVRVKNSSDAAETAKSLFSPTSSHQHSSCSVAPDTDSQEGEIQGSPSLLQSPSMTVVQPVSLRAEELPESCTAFPQDNGHDTQNVAGDCRTEKLPMPKNVLELPKEAEDSELDTQYLRNIFRHSKRLSFSLYPPMKACTVDAVAAENIKAPCAAQVENEHSKYLNPENVQEEKTAESLSKVCETEKLETYESPRASPATCFVGNTEFMHPGEHQEDVSQVANQGNPTPIKIGTARAEKKKGLQKGERGSGKTASTDTGMESELKQNPIKSKRNQSDQSDTEESIFKRTGLNTGDSICSCSESSQAGKAETVDSKGHFQSRSMICPASCQQTPAEFSREITGKKGSKRERKQVKGSEQQATQTAGPGMSECSVTETPEDSLKGNSDITCLSETPDGLLCGDDDAGENTSFSDTDRRERSAVFAKRSDNALVKELHKRSGSSKPRSQAIRRPRRKAQKLQSSDEESSEDVELPCFQALIFGKSVSTPLQINKQVASVVESSVSPIALPGNGSPDDDNLQKMPEATLSNGCDSPSQESECSVNLFSSQSNVSEESADGVEELKKPSVQDHTSEEVSNVNESKETLQSSNGRLKRSKTNFKDECQDPNMGANLGEASGYDSETSYIEDSCEPFSQGEILTTQQKNAMQNNLKKLQQEMAVLEAALNQHGIPEHGFLPLQRKLSPSSSEETPGMEQMRQRENTDEQRTHGTRPNSTSVLSNLSGNVTRSPNNSSSSARLLNPSTAEATNSSVIAQNAEKSCTQEQKSKRSVCFPVSVLPNATGKENATSPVVTDRQEMSFVASGLNQSEQLVVQKFARKTQSTLSNQFTEGTTHVIMKTDKDLVCERTLKYFLGIAGRKWVVSYQWVIQSFKEGRILHEEDFEVRGDVVNGRNHQGPKRARQALTEKIFKDFEICCWGPFTDMTTEHLERMVELCGASVVKQLHLFTHT